MVVDGNGDGPFGVLLADDVLVEALFDLFGLEDLKFVLDGLFLDDVHAEAHAAVADEALGSRDEFFYSLFGSAAEGTGGGGFLFFHHGLSSFSLLFSWLRVLLLCR